MYSETMLKGWVREHELQAPSMKNEPAFYRNLEQNLDTLRSQHNFMFAKPRWDRSVMDWTSSDFLSLNRTGRIREAFTEEMSRHNDYELSAAGSRVQYGNYDYLLEVENEIAGFFGSETAYIAHTGFMANAAMLACILQPGDAIVYDELSHTSTHEGMKLSMAAHKIPFKHNDTESLRDVLVSLKENNPEFERGDRSILIAVESIYSMDGDICPLRDCVDVAKEVFPLGNAQFIIDEAHSTGVLGPQGAGLVSELGLQKEIAIRIHMCSKALASTGGIVLCNMTIRRAMLNQGKFFIYSGAPSFPMIASIRAGFRLLSSGETKEAQERLQEVITYWYEQLTSNEIWEEAVDAGLLSCSLAEEWESRDYHSHIIPIRTRPRHEQYLFFHLALAGMNAYNISYPIVPKGQSRVRLVFHAHNTKEDVDYTINAICEWAREMLDIDSGESDETLPSGARRVYALESAA